MKKYLSDYFKFAVGILVFTIALTLTLGNAHGQARGPSESGANFAQKAVLFSADHPRIRAAIEAHRKYTKGLLNTFGVVGTGVGLDQDEPVLKVFATEPGITGIPESLDGFPVEVEVTGKIFAFDPLPTEQWELPVPIGVSTGNENECGAGTIGARVKGDRDGDGTDEVYALSNNHVYALVNEAINYPTNKVVQPGVYESKPQCDPALSTVIGELSDYEPIQLCTETCFWFWCTETCPDNIFDAAIASTSRMSLGNTIPVPADPNEQFTPTGDPMIPYIGQPVKKFGRTTSLTHGAVTTITANLIVCYDGQACTKKARFVNQIGIQHPDLNNPFGWAGDSGSLIVEEDTNRPVALLFAGSETHTFANPIAPVFSRFGVSLDDTEDCEGGQLADVAVTGVTAVPDSVDLDNSENRLVTVSFFVEENQGSKVLSSFNVILKDLTDDVVIGTQSVENLDEWESKPLSFYWDVPNEASMGTHTLEVSHNLPCDVEPSNDYAETEVEITGTIPPDSVHIGNLTVSKKVFRSLWRMRVTVTVHDFDHNPVANAFVPYTWSDTSATIRTDCTTDSSGTCTTGWGWQFRPNCLTFTVVDVIHDTLTEYAEDQNDVDPYVQVCP